MCHVDPNFHHGKTCISETNVSQQQNERDLIEPNLIDFISLVNYTEMLWRKLKSIKLVIDLVIVNELDFFIDSLCCRVDSPIDS